MSDSELDRREFLKLAAAGAAAGALGPLGFLGGQAEAAEASSGRGRLVEVIDPGWQTEGKPNPEVVARMISAGLRRLTGKRTVKDAWAALFKTTDVVGVKFNNLSPHLRHLNPPILDAVAAGLQGVGIVKRKIVPCEAIGADIAGFDQPDRRRSEPVNYGAGTQRLARFITHQITALIDVPNLKDHAQSGVTVSMKNVALSKNVIEKSHKMHPNNCDPHIAQVINLPEIKGKIRLIIVDALRAVWRGGPSTKNPAWQWNRNSLFFSLDPVATDTVGLQIINEERRRRRQGPVTGKARHIRTAAQMGLGEGDLGRIRWEKVKA